MSGAGAPAGGYGPVPALGADSTTFNGRVPVVRPVVPVWDRQVRSWLEGSLFDLDSDLTKHSCRSRTHRKRLTFQQETLMMTAPVGGDRPAPRHLHHRHRRPQRRRARPRHRSRRAPPATSKRSSCSPPTVSSQVGVEGSASWGAHVGDRARRRRVRCPRGPRAALRRSSGAHVGWTRPTPSTRSPQPGRCSPSPPSGPPQALEIYDPLVAKIEAVLEHRRCWSTVRTLVLHHVQDQLGEAAGRDPRPAHRPPARSKAGCAGSKHIDTTIVSTLAGAYRLSWLLPLVDQDRAARRQIRRLERRHRRAARRARHHPA